ncbi:copper amine oxidase N-terminal domain-containing protein [Paenibacillus sp. GCM10027626]|uniref:copper amine oxidase N-terminal domain-containing protein n=1 Tax=Paenibacillus sp. GCM10027626 TaxID=3273411 RepID=UPI0036281A22
MDDIRFQYAALAPEPERQKIVLKLGSKDAVVGGKAYKLDVAPFALNGTTYLPLRFVTEAMGAKVDWNQKLNRVTVLRGNRFMEMWLNKKQFILNGSKKEAAVAPISKGGRTLVPVRLVSEQLGLVVKWEGKTSTVTVE